MLRRVHCELAKFRDSLSLLSSAVQQSAGSLKNRPAANHRSALRNISEDRRPHLHGVGSLKFLQSSYSSTTCRWISLLPLSFSDRDCSGRHGIQTDGRNEPPHHYGTSAWSCGWHFRRHCVGNSRTRRCTHWPAFRLSRWAFYSV
jgi:hypothetical protein